jgi:ribulose-bisphosphate carboxylase large chain
MVVGLPSFEAITHEAGAMGIAVVAHPALSGAVRMAPAFLLGRLYRLLGADAVIFVNHGGRFGTPPEQCRSLADGLRSPWQTLRPALPLPAGGMTIDRVAEMVDFYGDDVALLISGALYPADAALDRRARAFVGATAHAAAEQYAAADRHTTATRHALASPATPTGSHS